MHQYTSPAQTNKTRAQSLTQALNAYRMNGETSRMCIKCALFVLVVVGVVKRGKEMRCENQCEKIGTRLLRNKRAQRFPMFRLSFSLVIRRLWTTLRVYCVHFFWRMFVRFEILSVHFWLFLLCKESVWCELNLPIHSTLPRNKKCDQAIRSFCENTKSWLVFFLFIVHMCIKLKLVLLCKKQRFVSLHFSSQFVQVLSDYKISVHLIQAAKVNDEKKCNFNLFREKCNYMSYSTPK